MGYLGTKPANSPLTSELIPDGIIATSDLQNNAVTEAKLQSGLYTAKAWVNFNGTGTVAIRASGNVSSITDNGTGDYTVNFTAAFVDTNYSVASTSGLSASTTYTIVCAPAQGNSPYSGSKTTTAIRMVTTNISGVYDTSEVCMAFFR